MSWSLSSVIDGLGQTVLGLLVGLLSLAIVIADCWTHQGRIALGIVSGILAFAGGYWFCLIHEYSATRVYGWFGYDFGLATHGLDDDDDEVRFCNFCDTFIRRNELGDIDLPPAHRHPHHSYLRFPRVVVRIHLVTP